MQRAHFLNLPREKRGAISRKEEGKRAEKKRKNPA